MTIMILKKISMASVVRIKIMKMMTIMITMRMLKMQGMMKHNIALHLKQD